MLRLEEVEKVLIYDLENKHINLCLEAVWYYPISEGNQQLPFEEVIESSLTFFQFHRCAFFVMLLNAIYFTDYPWLEIHVFSTAVAPFSRRKPCWFLVLLETIIYT